jgi:hypothetical protein
MPGTTGTAGRGILTGHGSSASGRWPDGLCAGRRVGPGRRRETDRAFGLDPTGKHKFFYFFSEFISSAKNNSRKKSVNYFKARKILRKSQKIQENS